MVFHIMNLNKKKFGNKTYQIKDRNNLLVFKTS